MCHLAAKKLDSILPTNRPCQRPCGMTLSGCLGMGKCSAGSVLRTACQVAKQRMQRGNMAAHQQTASCFCSTSRCLWGSRGPVLLCTLHHLTAGRCDSLKA